jgi:hypothetical protein
VSQTEDGSDNEEEQSFSKRYAELQAIRPGTTVSHHLTVRTCGYAPVNGGVLQNDIEGRRVLISDDQEYVFGLGRGLRLIQES